MFKKFGNKVKIRTTPDTEKVNVAGKLGEIFGQTVPSLSGVEVIGSPKKDFALNVYFDDIDDSYWFDEDLIETMDINAGTDIVIGDKKFIKDKSGNWLPDIDSSSNDNIQDLDPKNDLIYKLLTSEIRKVPLKDEPPNIVTKNSSTENAKVSQTKRPPKKWWQFWRA